MYVQARHVPWTTGDGALSKSKHAHLSPHSLADCAGVAAELADEARELEQRVEPVEDAHVAEADLLVRVRARVRARDQG